MRPETTRHLHEARDARQNALAGFTSVSSMNATGAGALFNSAELAIKSVAVEKHAAIPSKYRHHRLVDLAKDTGVWPELPADLQTFVTDISLFDPNVRYPGEPAHETLVNASTSTQWRNLLADGERLVDFIEQKVIGDPAVISRLNP